MWHTRALVDTLKTLSRNASVTSVSSSVFHVRADDLSNSFREDPHQPHCYESVFDNAEVQRFVDGAMLRAHQGVGRPSDFTLTVSIPSESGSLHGWSIHSLQTPGRSAFAHVSLELC